MSIMAEPERLPGYLRLHRSGELEERAERAHEVLRDAFSALVSAM